MTFEKDPTQTEETFPSLMEQIEVLKKQNAKIRTDIETLESQEGQLNDEQDRYGMESDGIIADLKEKIEARR